MLRKKNDLKNYSLIFTILILPLLFPSTGIKKIDLIPAALKEDWAKLKLKDLTLREKIGQMIITSGYGNESDVNSSEYKRLKKLVQNENIGGIIFFKGNSQNQAILTNRLQEISNIPLLISQDFERGTAMRLDDGSLFPNNMALGATRNPELAYRMGIQIAKECKAIGVHQNYAPVLDINNNPNNPIINVRSFGEDPELVSLFGNSFIKGIQEEGIIATAKHFPGHGDTDIDSHSDLPVLNFDIDRLNRIELIPFKNAIREGVKSIMIAHISFPALDKREYVPSSLSEAVVNNLLINELGYKGLIITDALNMDGITKHFSTKEVAVMCVKAGIDLILMPQGEKAAIDAIENAVNKGIIKEERINESVFKILQAKEFLGLNKRKFVNAEKVKDIINSPESQHLAQEIAYESITLVKNDNDFLPIKKLIDKKCLLISLNNGSDKANSDLFINEFTERAKKIFLSGNNIEFTGEINNLQSIQNEANNYDIIIFPVFAKVKIRTGTVGLPKSQIDLINSLTNSGKEVIVISLGNPYLIRGFEDIDSYICSYGDAPVSVIATIKAIFGEIPFKGKLPISINDNYKFGTGIIK